MAIDSMTEDTWADRIKNALERFREHKPDNVNELYLQQLEATIHEMAETIVELRVKVRKLGG